MCSVQQYLRHEDEKEGPQYEKGQSYFTVAMHHGGSFTTDGNKYLGGKINYFDYCDEDLTSLLELEDMAEQVGCSGKMYFHYFDKNGVQLQLLDDDHFWALLSTLFKSPNKYKVVSIYVSQLRDEVNEVLGGAKVNEDLGGACLTYEQPIQVELEAEEEDGGRN